MINFNRKKHWENIYQTKNIDEVSWYQLKPKTSLSLIEKHVVDKSANIIDVGGGDSFLVDHLLALGYQNITVLDISDKAIEKVKNRLGNKANFVKWITADITTFVPSEEYDVWHDRAAFHFLTDKNEIGHYVGITTKNISKNGLLIFGTFSDKGPEKCSGIEIKQYSGQELESKFNVFYNKLECFTMNHKTPFDTIQNFVFCVFRKL